MLSGKDRSAKFYAKHKDKVISEKLLRNLRTKGMIPTLTSLNKYCEYITFDKLFKAFADFKKVAQQGSDFDNVKQKFINRIVSLI